MLISNILFVPSASIRRGPTGTMAAFFELEKSLYAGNMMRRLRTLHASQRKVPMKLTHALRVSACVIFVLSFASLARPQAADAPELPYSPSLNLTSIDKSVDP